MPKRRGPVTRGSRELSFNATASTSAMSTTTGHAGWDPAVSIPTLFGSLLSMTATASVILLWTFARGKKRRDFRYALVLNLAVAECINSTNNSISGIFVVSTQRSPLAGTACNLNGWAGQFSVMAVDFSILAITIVTLLTIQLRSSIIYASTITKALICISIWIIPLCTSMIALAKKFYGPVSGNWCWIEKRYVRERYMLNHGWRIGIFFISLCTYAYVFVYMVRRIRPKNLASLSASSFDSFEQRFNMGYDPQAERERSKSAPERPSGGIRMDPVSRESGNVPDWGAGFSFARGLQLDIKDSAYDRPSNTHQGTDASAGYDIERLPPLNKEFGPEPDMKLRDLPSSPTDAPLERSATKSAQKIDREIWRMLLLNMYPVTYLILWLPGMLNRMMEALGYNVHALAIMQSSTQFIGFANATVYIYQEHRKDIRGWFDALRVRKYGRHEVLPDLPHQAPPPRSRPWTIVTV
ncbi:hypothetical protein NX059_010564 [Plenodomus lindquistii]|nr:hypothetical protein NX059_010564 [Plenodomus lindquistii]